MMFFVLHRERSLHEKRGHLRFILARIVSISKKTLEIVLLELRHRRGERDDPGYSYQRHDDS